MDITEVFEKIFDLLVKEAGAYPEDRELFLFAFTTDNRMLSTREFRIRGRLGRGGKFWRSNGHYYVTCYSEDETPEIKALLTQLNTQLAKFPYMEQPKEY